jgi:hypothetical protein
MELLVKDRRNFTGLREIEGWRFSFSRRVSGDKRS